MCRNMVKQRFTGSDEVCRAILCRSQLTSLGVLPSPLDLIIFDCDGVLIDSEIIANRVYPAVLAELGYAVSEADMDRFVGMTDAAMFAALERERGRRLPADLGQRLAAALKQAYARELRPITGAAETLAALPVPICVASSSSPDKLRLGLELAGLYRLVAPHVFSAAQVARGKPAPDLFQFAAARMGAAPSACLVIEDSVAGVRGARAAGMTVFGFCGGGHCRPGHGDRLLAEGAARIFAEMRELPGLLDRD